MMIKPRISVLVASTLALAACGGDELASPPKPFAINAESTGHYCGMNLTEHPGPKGQIILSSVDWPVWFSSARETLSFTMLAEEPKDIRAIYVSDMAKAPSWEAPGADNWIEARRAFYVIGSRKQGGMGAPETVPFSSRQSADLFAAGNGGRVVAFDGVPREYVLSAQTDAHHQGGDVK